MLLQAKETEYGRMLSARELHTYLEIGRVFASWIRGRISKYQFENQKDYAELWVDNKSGKLVNSSDDSSTMVNSGYTKDYFISIDMAKELCVLENKSQGRRARKYLQACEENHMNYLKAKLYLLDEGKIDYEKIGEWQEMLEIAKEFKPTLMRFSDQMSELLSCSFKLTNDMNGINDQLFGIEGKIEEL